MSEEHGGKEEDPSEKESEGWEADREAQEGGEGGAKGCAGRDEVMNAVDQY